MNALNIIEQSALDGLSIRLSESGTVKYAGDTETVNRWLPLIREHKNDIALALSADATKIGADETAAVKSCGWVIHYADRESVTVFSHPPVCHEEVLKSRPDAIAAVPILEQPKRMEAITAADRETLRLWFEHVSGDDPDDLRDLVETCMNNAEAMEYYRATAKDAGIVIDDLRTCAWCMNLKGQVCAAAVKLGASRGYRPVLMLKHPGRCREYLPAANDPDRRPGAVRWAGWLETTNGKESK